VKAQATGAAIAFLIGHAAPGLAESLSGELAGPANFKDAVAALARCGKKVDSDAVCRAMRYRVLDVVAEDVVTLGASRHPPDRALLVKMLRRPEVQLRAAAADAFGIGSPAKDEVGPLVEALNDPVPLVRRKVGRAIRNLSDPRALAAAERNAARRSPRLATRSALHRTRAGQHHLHAFAAAPDPRRRRDE